MTRQTRSIYVCQSCGYQAPKWIGRCPDCGRWDSMVEEAPKPSGKRTGVSGISQAQTIDAISLAQEMRMKTGLPEFDRTLGGGVVPGSVVLIG
ncbi:MAG: DNA repair protein RadA, partial [Deltaproteobacteria bacterium]|nr:DNA repair protein RadA [Deltaproteobacteria bacterium]